MYEPLANNNFTSPDNFYTAPDRTPVPAYDAYEVLPKSSALPPPPPAPESSQNGGNQKSQKPSGQEATDLRSEENKSKVKKSTKVVKRSHNKPSTQDEINPLLSRDVEKEEEMARQNLRLQRFVQEHQKKAFRTKVCIWVTTFILIFFGIALTTFLLLIFFTECFGQCNGLVWEE